MTPSTTVRNAKPKPGAAAKPAPQLIPKAVREEAGLTRVEMADLLGMSEFGYAQWEAGSRRPGGPAYRLLHLIDREGETVIEALRTAPV